MARVSTFAQVVVARTALWHRAGGGSGQHSTFEQVVG